MTYSFQTEKIKQLTDYEGVTQKILLLIESILQNVKQSQHMMMISRM